MNFQFLKKLSFALICGTVLSSANAVSVAWISGNKDVVVPPSYGTGATPSTTNTPGGRAAAVSWVDANDNIYVWGGVDSASGVSVAYSDMWRYSRTDNTWEWFHGPALPVLASVHGVKGEFAPGNIPETMTFTASWMGNDGMLYMFGGNGVLSESNTMWKFNPEIRQWAWVAGDDTPSSPGVYTLPGEFSPANSPGARMVNAYWKDGDRLYIMGGAGYDTNGDYGLLNDVWAFDVPSQQWALISGPTVRDSLGTYGIKGVTAPGNIPGARFNSGFTVDNDGNLWLYGGAGFDAVSESEALQDLWKRDKTTGYWTWVAGFKELEEPYALGYNSGIENFHSNNTPPVTLVSTMIFDPDDNLWLIGGATYQVTIIGPDLGLYAQHWKYDTTLNQWALMKDYPFADAQTYGTKGQFSTNNRLGALIYNSFNKFQDGTYFSFGGIRLPQSLPPYPFGHDNLHFIKFPELDITGAAGKVKTKYTNNPKKGESTTVKISGLFEEVSGKGLPATFATVYVTESTDYPVLGNPVSMASLKAIKEPKPGKTAKPGKFSVSLRYPGDLTGKYIAIKLDGGEMVDEKSEKNNVIFVGPIAP